MKRFIALVGLALASVPAQAGPISNPILYNYGKSQLLKTLTQDGYKSVEISFAILNRSPIQCSGEDTQLYLYKATLNGRKVSGFGCYRGLIWGIAYWDD